MDQIRQGVHVTSISPEAQAQLSQLVNLQEDALCFVVQTRIVKSLWFEGMYGRYDMVDKAHSETFRWIYDSTRSEESEHRSGDDYSGEDDVDAIVSGKESVVSDGGEDDLGDNERGDVVNDDKRDDVVSDGERDDSSDRLASEVEIEQDKMRCRAREKFVTWLSEGEGVFHISGKLGSGKSTLMKYICDHWQTEEHLKKWAGTRIPIYNIVCDTAPH